MPSLDPHIFRAYDIRGLAHTQITADGCRAIGQAFGSEVRRMYDLESPKIVVGHDARTHSPEFEQAVVDGLQAAGCHVLRIGQTPSPINYFTICNQDLDGGVQITASHNPAEDNGLKLQIREAEAYCGDDLQHLNQQITNEDYLHGDGTVEDYDGITPYLNHLQTLLGRVAQDMKVVIDSGNGVAGPVYSQAIEQAGVAVTGLYIEPDGTFPNHPADPSKYDTLKDLQAEVTNTKAACGLAFDGDGDRLGLVDEHGDIRTADEILLLLAKDHLHRFSGGAVVFTVSNSGTLESEIINWDGKPVMCKVGHSFVEHAMRDSGALLGGEQSGHFFCSEDYYGFDDALVAALRVLKIVNDSDKTISELCAEFPAVYQAPERRPHCPDDKKTEIVEQVTAHFKKEYPVVTLDGARIDFGDGAWAGIRQSNTSPKLSICLEARSKKRLEEVESIILEHLETYPEIDL